MAYSRDNAYNYAHTHWNTNCHDKIISLIGSPSINVDQKWKEMGLSGRREDWEVKWFRTDPIDSQVAPESAAFVNRFTGDKAFFQYWRGLGDCAHFMSRTLTAGGIEGLNTDFVPYLNGFLRNPARNTKVLADEAPGDRTERIISKKLMKKGDVILYVAPPGGELGGGYVHSAMFVSESTITCHTVSRWNEDWKAPHYDGYTFTLIHFSHDDVPNAGLNTRIGGWWELTWRGQNYYYFFASGGVSYTQQRPTTRVPLLSKQRGHYFPQPLMNQILICWPQTGSVEDLTLSVDGQSLNGRWNDTELLSATKMTI
jgi:hypothetical protein